MRTIQRDVEEDVPGAESGIDNIDLECTDGGIDPVDGEINIST